MSPTGGCRRKTRWPTWCFWKFPSGLPSCCFIFIKSNGSAGGRSGQPLRGKMTHQELANVIGSTRETTTLILNDFKRQGLIDFLGRKILITNRAGLEEFVASDLAS